MLDLVGTLAATTHSCIEQVSDLMAGETTTKRAVSILPELKHAPGQI